MGFKQKLEKKPKSEALHLEQHYIDIVFVIANGMFVIGSYCFLESWAKYYWIGDWLFIIGSVAQFLLAAVLTWEDRKAMSDGLDLLDVEDDEFFENVCSVIASGVFAAGSIFYMPDVYPTPEDELKGHITGTWLFIFGSAGLVVAAYFNSLGLGLKHGRAKERSEEDKFQFKWHAIGLLCSLLGSVTFCIGSYLYRPGLSTICEKDEEVKTDEVCISTAEVGTYLYITGSFLFLAQSCASLYADLKKQPGSDETTPILNEAARKTLNRKESAPF